MKSMKTILSMTSSTLMQIMNKDNILELIGELLFFYL
jgi:hypothetical protein